MDRKEQLKQFRQSGKEELAASIAPDTVNEDARTVDIVFFSGVDVPRYDWWSDTSYTLVFDPKGADLSLLNNRAPLIDNHFVDGVESQLGVVLKAWTKGKNYLATIQFKRSTEATGPRPEVDGLWQDVKDGIVSKFSMGVELTELIDKRNKDGKLETRTATKWVPYELSIAPIPADFNTTTLSAQQRPSTILSAARRRREIEILSLR